MSIKLQSSQVQSVAIIGGGASGSIALDSLIKEDHVKSITLFERRATFGGIWNLDENVGKTPNSIIKAGNTQKKTDPQLPNPFNQENREKGRFILLPKSKQERFSETPSYRNLTTNIIEEIMTFSDINKWDVPGETDPDKTRYVNGLVVRDYIEKYIERNIDNEKVSVIKSTTVEDVEEIGKKSQSSTIPKRYKLTLRQSVNADFDIWWQETYDAVIVATGHYFVPFIPDVKGLADLQELKPEAVQHAKYYRTPKEYKDETVVVIGSRALGADLAKYIADDASQVYQSIRNLANTRAFSKKSNVGLKPIVKEYQIIDKAKKTFKVIFEDGSEVVNPDHVIYATGYQFSFPFLNRLIENDSGSEVVKDGVVIQNLYQHTFLIDHPLINFIGMPIDGVSFRVFEYQAVLVARYLAGKVTLPSKEEQHAWCENRLREKGSTRAYHTIGLEAPVFHGELTKLGEVDTTKLNVGRPFPVLTEPDYAEYKLRALKLAEHWDER